MIKNKLGKFVRIKTGKLDANASSSDGKYPFFTCSKEPLKISSYSYDCRCVLVAGNGELNVKYYDGKFDAYQRTYIIESNDELFLNTRYLYWFLSKYVEKLRELAIGGVIKYIKLNNLTEPTISLPSIEDQKRIVKILDEADAVRQKRKQAIELLDDYLKSVFLEMFGDPVKNPKKWEVSRLEHLIKKITAGWSVNGEDRQKLQNEYGVLKISSVTYGSFNPQEYKAVRITEISNKILVHPKKGSIIFSRANTRELVGASCIVTKDYPDLFLPDKLWEITVNTSKITPVFFQRTISNVRWRNELAKKATGTSGSMLNISMDKFKNEQIMLPPIEIQLKFAEIVKNTDFLKQKMLAQSKELETQFQALVYKAFSENY